MSPQQAYRNVKSGMTLNFMEKDFFRWLKVNKAEELLAMQNSQLFDKSKGADGVLFGNYKKNAKGKTRGMPFTMVDTGQLKRKMRVNVLIGKLEIQFINNRDRIDEIRKEKVFATSDWFGLTPQNTKILDAWAMDFAIGWTLNKFYTGNGRYRP